MVLKTVYRRIRKSIPRIGGSKRQSTNANDLSSGKRHAKDGRNHNRDDVDMARNKSPQEELREEYQELIRTSYRMVRCLGDDLESSLGSSYVSGYRYREQSKEEILAQTPGISRSHRNYVHEPIVTHLLYDSDDENFGLRFANMAASEDSKDETESRESSSVFINIDECRDTDSRRLGAASQRDEDICYHTNKWRVY